MLKSIIKRSIHRLGFDLRRYNPATSDGARFMAALSSHNVNLVFDVGANEGQFGRGLRELGYTGRIVSFEPLLGPWNKLTEARRDDLKWEVAPRAAIGSEDGETEMHVAGNSVSSSVLKMLDAHVKAAPASAYVGTEQLPMRRLDAIGKAFVHPDSVLFIKIDTQGFESQVLKGAPQLLEKAVGVHLELSFVPLYEGQSKYDGLISQLEGMGFEMWDILPNFVDPESSRLLQADATFFRR